MLNELLLTAAFFILFSILLYEEENATHSLASIELEDISIKDCISQPVVKSQEVELLVEPTYYWEIDDEGRVGTVTPHDDFSFLHFKDVLGLDIRGLKRLAQGCIPKYSSLKKVDLRAKLLSIPIYKSDLSLSNGVIANAHG